MLAKPDKLPKGLEITHREGQLQLSYRHHRVAGFFLFCAGLFWLFMLPPCYRVLATGDSFGWWDWLAFLPFLGAALGFGYVGLAKMLNRTELVFTADAVKVHHHPLPWLGAVELAAEGIKGYRIQQDIKPRDVRHIVTVGLVADLVSGTQIPLLRAITDSRAARTMQQHAQAYLEEMRAGNADLSEPC